MDRFKIFFKKLTPFQNKINVLLIFCELAAGLEKSLILPDEK
jgi:hypothetical protein